jgi:hypothetical protein
MSGETERRDVDGAADRLRKASFDVPAVTYDWLDERPEAEQELDPPDMRRRRSQLRRIMARAQAALPASARDSDRRELEDDVAYYMVDDDVLLRPGMLALSVASAFARIVTERYATADDDARAMRKLNRHLDQDWFKLRRLDPLSKMLGPLGQLVDSLNESLQPRSAGRRGWKEFRCWVQLLIHAYEDIYRRKATVSHDCFSGPARRQSFGAFPEFVERHVALLEQAPPTWWPESLSARRSLVDHVVYAQARKPSVKRDSGKI